MSYALLLSDASTSVLLARPGAPRHYAPFGALSGGVRCGIAFNGQWLEQECYLLGNGYRVYLPTLMRFSRPDKGSPFGEGGLNVYAYGLMDPVNNSDPQGRFPLALWKALKRAVGSTARRIPGVRRFLDRRLPDALPAVAPQLQRQGNHYIRGPHVYLVEPITGNMRVVNPAIGAALPPPVPQNMNQALPAQVLQNASPAAWRQRG